MCPQYCYPKDDIYTRSAISACYALVPALLDSDPLSAACMFIAAENTVAFLCEKDPTHELAHLPAGIIALQSLQKFIKSKRNLDVLASLIFSYSRRYISQICHDNQGAALAELSLADLSKLFLVDAEMYFQAKDYTIEKRALLISIACNMYCILGCRLGISRSILIELMRGVVSASPEKYWFFRYNLESLAVGSQDEQTMARSQYRPRLEAAQGDALLNAMIISGLKRDSSWCSIL